MDKRIRNTGIAIFTGVCAIFGIKALVSATGAANTAEKLIVDYEGVKFSEVKYYAGFIPKSVIISIYLKLTNPTSNELSVSKPFITLSVVGNGGTKKRLANTAQPTTDPTVIKANNKTSFKHDVEVQFVNALTILPGFVDYAIKRFRGAVASQKVLADISLDALGVTLSQTKTILI